MSVTVKVKTDDSTMIAKNLKEVVTTKHHNGKIITLTIDTNGINIDIVNENGLSDGRWVSFDVINRLIEG
jgi:hypothetical protein